MKPVEPLILVIGETGQVARALRRTQPRGLRVEFLSRAELDLSRLEEIRPRIEELCPRVVINAAAYTAVDLAESEPELAERVNAQAPAEIAKACAAIRATFIHYSTDYVFAGSGETPREEDAPIAPLSVYGRTKAEGEARVREACPQHLILRTSWVYDFEGKNFVRTMLKLGAEREVLRVVSDQIGAPTSATEIALATWALVESSLEGQLAWGTYHLVARGETSWHGFAKAIFEEASRLGIPLRVRDVQPIATSEYPTPARRPLNSRLSTEKFWRAFGIALPEWRNSLRVCLRAIADQQGNTK